MNPDELASLVNEQNQKVWGASLSGIFHPDDFADIAAFEKKINDSFS